MNHYRNVAFFDQQGNCVRLVSGPAPQVEANISQWDGPTADVELGISEIDQVPTLDELQANQETI